MQNFSLNSYRSFSTLASCSRAIRAGAVSELILQSFSDLLYEFAKEAAFRGDKINQLTAANAIALYSLERDEYEKDFATRAKVVTEEIVNYIRACQ